MELYARDSTSPLNLEVLIVHYKMRSPAIFPCNIHTVSPPSAHRFIPPERLHVMESRGTAGFGKEEKLNHCKEKFKINALICETYWKATVAWHVDTSRDWRICANWRVKNGGQMKRQATSVMARHNNRYANLMMGFAHIIVQTLDKNNWCEKL